MAKCLKVTKDMLTYREGILAVEEIDTIIMDLDTAIEELKFAFSGENGKEFKMSFVNGMMKSAAKNNLGLGDGFKRIIEEFNFPFREKSLFRKRILVTDLNGGLNRISECGNYDLNALLQTLIQDQVEAEKYVIYDIRDIIKTR